MVAMRSILSRARFFVGAAIVLGSSLDASLASAQANPNAPPAVKNTPPPPEVSDPMLIPVPPAQRNIATWEEALAFVRARSTDLKTAYDEILRATAQTRLALAAAGNANASPVAATAILWTAF